MKDSQDCGEGVRKSTVSQEKQHLHVTGKAHNGRRPSKGGDRRHKLRLDEVGHKLVSPGLNRLH